MVIVFVMGIVGFSFEQKLLLGHMAVINTWQVRIFPRKKSKPKMIREIDWAIIKLINMIGQYICNGYSRFYIWANTVWAHDTWQVRFSRDFPGKFPNLLCGLVVTAGTFSQKKPSMLSSIRQVLVFDHAAHSKTEKWRVSAPVIQHIRSVLQLFEFFPKLAKAVPEKLKSLEQTWKVAVITTCAWDHGFIVDNRRPQKKEEKESNK